MKKLIYILFTVSLFVLPVTASAQMDDITNPGVYIGPMVGYQKASDAEEGNLMGGVAIRGRVSSAFGIEASINYRKEKYAENQIDVKTWPVMVTAMFYPLPIVYAAAGFGWYNTTIDYNSHLENLGMDDDTSQEVGWHFGGGIDIPIGDRVSLTGDIRYVFIDYDFEEVPGTDEINNDFYIIQAGILFRLF